MRASITVKGHRAVAPVASSPGCSDLAKRFEAQDAMTTFPPSPSAQGVRPTAATEPADRLASKAECKSLVEREVLVGERSNSMPEFEGRFSCVAGVRPGGPAEYRSAGLLVRRGHRLRPCHVAFARLATKECQALAASNEIQEGAVTDSPLVRSTMHVVMEGKSVVCAVA